MAQMDSSTEALDTDEGRRVTERIVARAWQIQEREQGETVTILGNILHSFQTR